MSDRVSLENKIAYLEDALKQEQVRIAQLQKKLESAGIDFEKKHKQQVEANDERDMLLNKLQEVIVEYQDKENQLEKEHDLLEEAYHRLEKTNQELEQKNLELSQLDELKSSFLSMISHELRTPITVVQGNTELLLDHFEHLSPKQTHVLLNTMIVRLKELIFLVETLLHLASIEAKKFNLYPSWILFDEVMQSILGQINPLLHRKEIKFILKIAEPAQKVYIDRDSFILVLINLLVNAIKFNHDGGQIKLSAMIYYENESPHLLVTVEDTGIGIDPSQHQQIFRKFYQIDSSNTRQYGGSGIGLALAQEVVHLHKGRIWVESVPEKGSSFFILLPQPAQV